MSSFEARAVAALIRWCNERSALRGGLTVNLQASGYTPRQRRAHDSRLVRVLSFEQVFSTLDDSQQAALLLVYRDNLSLTALASCLRCSVPAAQARVSGARLSLADALDRRALL